MPADFFSESSGAKQDPQSFINLQKLMPTVNMFEGKKSFDDTVHRLHMNSEDQDDGVVIGMEFN